jgi:sulfur carrier protein ThiS
MKKIHVIVKLHSNLSKGIEGYDHSTGLRIDLNEGNTAADMLKAVGLSSQDAPVVVVNNIVRKIDYQLADGDEVNIFGLIGGG